MDHQRNHHGQKNKWRRSFLILLMINIFIIGIISVLIFWPVSNDEMPQTNAIPTDESSSFTIKTTKENLNELVNAYLTKLSSNSEHHYQVRLEDDVHLIGDLPVFSTTVPLTAHLDPVVQDDGNITLKLKSISIGLLPLPNQKIMKYMKKFLPMPDWVKVNPKKEEIYVAVNKMRVKSNFQVGIKQFDLKANKLAFKITVPYKTLGTELAKLSR